MRKNLPVEKNYDSAKAKAVAVGGSYDCMVNGEEYVYSFFINTHGQQDHALQTLSDYYRWQEVAQTLAKTSTKINLK